MSHSDPRTKSEWRRELRLILKNGPEAREEESAKARALLSGQPIWKEASSVLFYSPLPTELDLGPLIQLALKSGKIVLLPRFLAETGTYEAVRVSDITGDCAPGKYGIAEPGRHCAAYPLKSLDLALTPGLGFDLAGRRLGRGGGYYDRLLAEITGVRCGVAFDRQIVGEVPAEGHDIRMDFILTPTRWLKVEG